MDLTGISNFCGDLNLSGLIKVEYAPTAWIDPDSFQPIVNDQYNLSYNLLFKQGDWLHAHLLPNRRLWTETQSRTTQGPHYDQLVKAIVPNLQPQIAGEFRRMANYRYLLRLQDIEDRQWLLGTPESPFQFFADGTTGENGSLKHHAIRFVSRTPHKAYGFHPLFNI